MRKKVTTYVRDLEYDKDGELPGRFEYGYDRSIGKGSLQYRKKKKQQSDSDKEE